jgi:AcrR family transcriptional regulator
MSQARQRRPLLSAAVEVFAERGYPATSVDHLLEAMALGRTAFRHRFVSKERCFLAAYDHIVAVAHGRLAATMAGARPWPQRVAAGLWTVLELTDANPASARLVLVESQFAGDAALDRYTATVDSLTPLMREGRQLPSASEQLPPLIDSVLPAGVAFSLRCQLLRRGPVRDLYNELLRFLLLPYLGEAQTAAHLAWFRVSSL